MRSTDYHFGSCLVPRKPSQQSLGLLDLLLLLSPCVCPLRSVPMSVLLNVFFPVPVRSAQCLSLCICPFCSMSLSLYLSLLLSHSSCSQLKTYLVQTAYPIMITNLCK